ncbi:hypothetical protein ABT147_42160 [Streptomyces sp. NPDC001868]|uniref:hypothetical protein n=1 Tax=Streptomyces sp. NPDC001868 TaxID=3154401 RepID=UPI0033182D81
MTDPYIGRRWLRERLAAWWEDGTSMFTVTGSPGTGKTAFVDDLAARSGALPPDVRLIAHHCRAERRATCDPVRFVERLSEALAAWSPEFLHALTRIHAQLTGTPVEVQIVRGEVTAQVVEPGAEVSLVRITIQKSSADEALDLLVRRPLEQVTLPGEPLVVVDALDEAVAYDSATTIPRLILGHLPDLPLRFLVTTRPDPRIPRQPLAGHGPVVDLVEDEPPDQDDVRKYAFERLSALAGQDRAGLARRISEASGANFLYARHVTEELRQGRRSADDVLAGQDLPSGLIGLYRQFMSREVRPPGQAGGERYWRDRVRPCLAVVTAAQENGLAPAQLADILDLPRTEIHDFFRLMGQYLAVGPDGLWRLFHPSFGDFLVHGNDPYLDCAEGHRRIVRYAVDAWGDNWARCEDEYFLRNVAHHLALALRCPSLTRGEREALTAEVYRLALSGSFLAAQSGLVSAGDGHALALSTIVFGVRTAIERRDHGRLAVLALRLSEERARADTVTPTELAATRGVEAGLARARTYTRDDSLMWLLLIAFGAAVRGDADGLRQGLDELARVEDGKFSEGWSELAGLLLARIGPAADRTEAARLCRLADHSMLGWIALHQAMGPVPYAAVLTALWIDDEYRRARAVSELLSWLTRERLVSLGDVRLLADLVLRVFERDWAAADRALGREPGERDTFNVSFLLPDVPEAYLIAKALLGDLAAAKQLLTTGPHSIRTTSAALLHAHTLAAIAHPDRFARSLGDHVVRALWQDDPDMWVCLHYANYLAYQGDCDQALEIVEPLIIRLGNSLEDEFDYVGEHIDAFHGSCGIGLALALVRTCCQLAQVDLALSVCDLLQRVSPMETVRAYSEIAAWQDGDERARTLATGAALAERLEDPFFRVTGKTIIALDTGDPAVLKHTIAPALSRQETARDLHEPVIRAVLARGAARRGDGEQARAHAAAVVKALGGDPPPDQSDKWPSKIRQRAARHLLFAGLPDEAAVVIRDPDLFFEVAAGGRCDLAMALAERTWPSLAEAVAHWGEQRRRGRRAVPLTVQTLRRWRSEPIGHLLPALAHLARETGDEAGLRALRAVAGRRINVEIETEVESLQGRNRSMRPRAVYSFHEAGRERAALLAVASAEFGDVPAFEKAVQLHRYREFMEGEASMGWDAFRGYMRSREEMAFERYKVDARLAGLVGQAAAAFRRAGDTTQAAARLAEAEDLIEEIKHTDLHASASITLAAAASRCRDFALTRRCRRDAMVSRNVDFGPLWDVLLDLATHPTTPEHEAAGVLLEVFTGAEFTSADHLELVSMLTVLTPEVGDEVAEVVADSLAG